MIHFLLHCKFMMSCCVVQMFADFSTGYLPLMALRSVVALDSEVIVQKSN